MPHFFLSSNSTELGKDRLDWGFPRTKVYRHRSFVEFCNNKQVKVHTFIRGNFRRMKIGWGTYVIFALFIIHLIYQNKISLNKHVALKLVKVNKCKLKAKKFQSKTHSLFDIVISESFE